MGRRCERTERMCNRQARNGFNKHALDENITLSGRNVHWHCVKHETLYGDRHGHDPWPDTSSEAHRETLSKEQLEGDQHHES
jgi:hypothetical protein